MLITLVIIEQDFVIKEFKLNFFLFFFQAVFIYGKLSGDIYTAVQYMQEHAPDTQILSQNCILLSLYCRSIVAVAVAIQIPREKKKPC